MANKKELRRQKALSYLKQQLGKDGKSTTYVDAQGVLRNLKEVNTARIKKEIVILEKRIAGEKKADKRRKETVPGVVEDKWYIDIYSINFSRVKRSDRKKNKGKSRKKMRQIKTVSLVKSIVAQPGMIASYKEGRMGISPKHHAFKLRKDEPFNL